MDKDLIKRLSYDKAFGILTRNALDEKINNLKKFNCIFIDLCNLKKLNNLLGYDSVNHIIKKMFTEYNKNKEYVIGRWFSGDEIIIITDDVETALTKLINVSQIHNLSFKWVHWNNVKSVKEIETKVDNIDLNTGDKINREHKWNINLN